MIVIIFYDVGQLVVFGLPQSRKNVFGYFTHRFKYGEVLLTTMIAMRFFMKRPKKG